MTDSAAKSTHRVDANAEKRFFIDMLVKDIELLPAIIDLVDNSVDGARGMRGTSRFDGLRVHIVASPDRFEIRDNCGGIPIDVARRYAFRFGRSRAFKGVTSSVGQFGIGMKRALFKIGTAFQVESTAASSSFRLAVDVNDWASDENADWSFILDDVDETISHDEAERGTKISVSPLHPNVSQDFATVKVINALRSQIALKHQAALSNGLEIEVNGRSLAADSPRLLQSSDIRPVNRTFQIPAGGGVVHVQVIAGVASPQDREDLRDDDEPADFMDAAEAGWYVYCNDRLVLAADRSPLTGWGEAAATYHPQYRRFRGYVFMNSEDSSLLPWNTTKTSLDQDSQVFRVVQQAMFQALATVLAVLNRVKMERQSRDQDDRPVTAALALAMPVDVVALPASSTFVAPPPQPRNPTPPHLITIQYRVPRSDVDEVIDALGASSASEAGRLTFEYYVESELR